MAGEEWITYTEVRNRQFGEDHAGELRFWVMTDGRVLTWSDSTLTERAVSVDVLVTDSLLIVDVRGTSVWGNTTDHTFEPRNPASCAAKLQEFFEWVQNEWLPSVNASTLGMPT